MDRLSEVGSIDQNHSKGILGFGNGRNQLRERSIHVFLLVGRKILGCIKKKESHMNVISTLAIGNRRELIIVNCDGRRYLVGAGTNSVGSIIELKDVSAV